MRDRAVPAGIIVGAWLLLALAWTPPTTLVDRPESISLNLIDGRTFLLLAVGFLPWMTATPFLLRLARLRPFSWRDAPSLLVHLGCALLIIPGATVAGRLLTLLLLGAGPRDPDHFITAATIGAFFSVPTYVAVTAIAHGLALKLEQRSPRLASGPCHSVTDNPLRRIVVRDKGRSELIDTRDIDLIEVAGHYLCIHVGGTVKITRGQLSTLEQRMDPSEFARISRSALIRMDRIRAVQERRNGDCDLILADGERVVLSRTYRDALFSRLGLSDL